MEQKSVSDKQSTPADNLTVSRGMGLEAAVTEFEQWFIWWALERNDFNQSQTAEELKTHRNNLVRRIHEWEWTDKVQAGHDGQKVSRK
jgi:DNA-binding NtrC family response regulator